MWSYNLFSYGNQYIKEIEEVKTAFYDADCPNLNGYLKKETGNQNYIRSVPAFWALWTKRHYK